MENASKALIIAAAILIAIVLITLGVFVLGSGGELVKKSSDMTEVEVNAFNQKFEAYCGDHVRGSTVKTLVNTINNNNRVAEDASKHVTITGADNILTGKTYKVEPDYDQNSGLLNTITVTLAAEANSGT